MAVDLPLFAKQLRANARKSSQHQCAKYVRLALQSAGANTVGHPGIAKAYGPLLKLNGFRQLDIVDLGSYQPWQGDVAIIEATCHGNKAGHIQAYDGKDWISDFVQNAFWPGAAYRKEKPSYAIYRY